MKVKFETVIDGINRYIDREIYKGLNELQEFAARLVVGRINHNQAAVKDFLMNNGFMKTLGIVDSEGMVDVDQLLSEIREEIERRGSLKVEIPLIGALTFKSGDVDVLYRMITGGE